MILNLETNKGLKDKAQDVHNSKGKGFKKMLKQANLFLFVKFNFMNHLCLTLEFGSNNVLMS